MTHLRTLGLAAVLLASAVGQTVAQPLAEPPPAPAVSGPAGPPASAAAGPPAPLLPYPEAVAARFPPPPVPYDTPGLRPGRAAFTSNDELQAALASLAASGAAQLRELARSGAGAPLLALHFSRAAGRPVVLLIGQQHGNEPAAAEALLVIARRLADPDAPLAAVLDRVDVVVLPRANPDGALLDRRTNALGLDVNRDHLLLRTPEAQAIAALAREHRPVLVVDLHEHLAFGRHMAALGGLKRHDLLLQYATTANLPPALAAASEAWFRQPLLQALAQAGVASDWYFTNPAADAGLHLAMGGVQPELARNASGLRHAVSVLLESRGMDLGRLHIQRRVHSHVVAVTSLLQSAAERAGDLAQLQADADLAVAARACHGDAVIEAAPTPQRRELLLLDPVTGADRAVMVDWDSALWLRPLRTRSRPCGYWLAASEAPLVARLQALGLRVRTLGEETALAVQRYRETARGEPPRSDAPGRAPGAAAPPLRVVVALEPGAMLAPPGSFYLPLDQPLAHLAIAALEPDTPSSYFAHRLLGSLAPLARVTAPPRWAAAPAP